MPGWLRKALGGNQEGRRVQSYLAVVGAEPDESDVQWLAAAATAGDEDRARWELRYARRVIGLLVAQRDALDDRTASVVSRELRRSLHMDRNIAAGMVRVAERQFNERLAAFRTGLEARTAGEAPDVRLGRILLGPARTTGDPGGALDRASAVVSRYMTEAGEALRAAFGTSGLPPDQPPSAWRARQSR
jgi:hypothetical protein